MQLVVLLGVFFGVLLGPISGGEIRSGRAVAQWHAMKETVRAGEKLMTALRLKLDAQWHSYWVNPGDGGMQTRAEFDLPEGWKAGSLEFPVPHRFESMGMQQLGYEGEIFIFVPVTVPENAPLGVVKLKTGLSWLTCNDDACVPGELTLTLPLEVVAGETRFSKDRDRLEKAAASLPDVSRAWKVYLTEFEDELGVEIELSSGAERLQGADLLFTTESVGATGARPRWTVQGQRAMARIKKSEYFETLPRQTSILLSGGALERAVLLRVKK